jgi:hypothetical protein
MVLLTSAVNEPPFWAGAYKPTGQSMQGGKVPGKKGARRLSLRSRAPKSWLGVWAESEGLLARPCTFVFPSLAQGHALSSPDEKPRSCEKSRKFRSSVTLPSLGRPRGAWLLLRDEVQGMGYRLRLDAVALEARLEGLAQPLTVSRLSPVDMSCVVPRHLGLRVGEHRAVHLHGPSGRLGPCPEPSPP